MNKIFAAVVAAVAVCATVAYAHTNTGRFLDPTEQNELLWTGVNAGADAQVAASLPDATYYYVSDMGDVVAVTTADVPAWDVPVYPVPTVAGADMQEAPAVLYAEPSGLCLAMRPCGTKS